MVEGMDEGKPQGVKMTGDLMFTCNEYSSTKGMEGDDMKEKRRKITLLDLSGGGEEINFIIIFFLIYFSGIIEILYLY